MILPPARTGKYSIWKACERFGILPPNVVQSWDECCHIAKAELLAYDTIRTLEEIPRGNES